jgi:hypothetical protein
LTGRRLERKLRTENRAAAFAAQTRGNLDRDVGKKEKVMAKDQKGTMTVSIEANGEFITTEVPQDATVRALFEGGHLRGIDAQAVRVNGRPATQDTQLEPEDNIQVAPTGGALA